MSEERITMTLERKFAAWLQGKEHGDTGAEYQPPKWVGESSVLERYYLNGYYGQNY